MEVENHSPPLSGRSASPREAPVPAVNLRCASAGPAVHAVTPRGTHDLYWTAYDSLRIPDAAAVSLPQTTSSRQRKVLEFLFAEEREEEEFIPVGLTIT